MDADGGDAGLPYHPPWRDVDDRCAPDDLEPVPNEPYYESKPPLGEPGEVLWTMSPTCGEASQGPFSDSLLYGVIPWGDQQKEVLVTINKRHSDFTLWEPAASISVIDAVNGKLLACYPFPTEWEEVTTRPMLTTDPPAVYLAYATPVGERPGGILSKMGVLGQELAPEEDARRLVNLEWDTGPVQEQRYQWLSFEGDMGVLLYGWYGSILAINPRTGETYWDRGGPGDVPDASGVEYGGRLSDNSVILRSYGPHGGRFYETDRCGEFSPIEMFDGVGVDWIFGWGDYFEHKKPDAYATVFRDSSFRELFEVDVTECGVLGALSNTELICSPSSNSSIVRVLDLPTNTRRTFDLAQLDPRESDVQRFARIPARHNKLIIESRYDETTPNGPMHAVEFSVLSLSDGSVSRAAKVLDPDNKGIRAVRLSHRGVLYLLRGSKLVALQLPVDGLAKSPWPQQRGGNTNRGLVELRP